ncbi:MAG: PilC/PilY family type IV pilus protein [Burkholderiaceae bacterium]
MPRSHPVSHDPARTAETPDHFVQRMRDSATARWSSIIAATILAYTPLAVAETDLSDQPARTTLSVPANVLLALSVEWPTGNVQAYNDETSGTGCPGRDAGRSACYFSPGVRASRIAAENTGNPSFKPQLSMPYIGYFDPYKCYSYNEGAEYFEPYGNTNGYDPTRNYKDQPTNSDATCGGAGWSGNFLNWSTMHTIDLFRWVMTGGDRSIDSSAMTVLEKARHDGQGGTAQFPVKQIGRAFSDVPITTPASVTPFTRSELYVSISGRDTWMRIASNSGITNHTENFRVRVKVCDPSYPETVTTCTAYSAGNLKPTGLIQENAMDVRFAAMGYLLDDDIYRDGGVLRARMKFVGPTRPVLGAIGELANTHREWDATTGVYVANPDPTDASATTGTIIQSGVTRYLNRFGRRDGYKNHDPVSEMYYEALRYYMDLEPTPEYSNLGLTGGGNPRKVDGFPIIVDWDDPLAPPLGFEDADEWCPNNFIIGIADANTHKDKRLPGNSSTVNEGGAQPSNAAGFPANVSTLLNEIITTELANEGVQLLNSSGGNLAPGQVNCCNGSAYIASLAYYANSRDIRPDSEGTIQSRGRQRVRSYFVDVRESGSWGTGVSRTDPRRRNQLWLAAKYGGFIDQNTIDPPGGPYAPATLDIGDAIADENGDGVIDIRDVWDRDGDDLPDNYYEAGSPEALVDGLKAAFSSIRAQVATAVGINTSTRSVELQTDTGIFRVSYDPAFWSGNLVGYTYSGFDEASGNITVAQQWNAADKLAAQGWDNGRRIVTWTKNSPTATGGVARPFRWGNLSGWQQNALDNDTEILEWLRGKNDIGAFRKRLRKTATGTIVDSKLGDIIDSEARYVGAPNAPLSEAYNPGYGAFKEAWKDRREMLYVGANDGMLHAFDARVDGDPAGGTEVFAYVPSFLYSQAAGAGPGVLADLASKTYVHRNYVNATAWIYDADFARTNGATGASGDWRSVLIGGLGKGGRGYFAIDVTDPSAFDTETGVAGKVLWEFQDPTMGYSFGAPQVVKTKRWGWVALLTSGYNNITSHGSSGSGQGWLYVVDIKTGALLQKISTSSGSELDPSGLAQVTAYTPDSADGTVTEVYGGDLRGNIWRFDFSNDAADVPSPVHFASLPAHQSITSGPIVRVAPITRNRYVFIGSGRMLGQDDIYTTQQQSFYAFRDGTRLAPWESEVGEAPSFPLMRSDMIANTDLLNPITPDPARPAGWYHDLLGGGERVVVDPQDTDLGKISWLGTIPQTTQICNEGGSSRIYAANFETGQSQLYDPGTLGDGTPTRITAFDPMTGAVGLRLVRVGGNIRAVITGQFNELKLTQGYLRYLDPRSMGWREITEPGT